MSKKKSGGLPEEKMKGRDLMSRNDGTKRRRKKRFMGRKKKKRRKGIE